MQTTVDQLNPDQRENIISFLKDHSVGVLATIGAEDGKPSASTIYIGVDDAINIVFTTKRETRKYKNISANGSVMLVVHDAAEQKEVQVSGQAIEVKDHEQQAEIYHQTLQAAKQTGQDIVPPVAKIPAGPYVGFIIKIENIWLSEYGWGDTFAQALKDAAQSEDRQDPA